MKTSRWFTRPNPLLLPLRIAIASALVIASVGMAFMASKTSSRAGAPAPRAFVFKKGDPDMKRAGDNKRAVFGANEYRGATYTPALEEFLKRAYPANDVPGNATIAAKNGFAGMHKKGHSKGDWQLRGPSRSTVPGVLNALGDDADYITAGRVTAMAIGPSCTKDNCPIYVAAAGGGVWRTKNGLKDNANWEFVSESFGTNAIGSLIVAPNDPSGRTLYAGTGEPNASGDSEAGVGIYKSTNGGDTWSLVPGSDIFFQRSLGQMTLDNAGNLLVPVASGVRGISSVSGGASSSGSTTHPLVSRGLYRQTGATFTQIFVSPAPTRGSTTVKVDPTHPGFIYVNSFQGGIFRSTNNGASFSQIFAPQDPTVAGSALDRSEFDVITLPGGATRMYVGEGQGGSPGHHSNFWRSDNADTAATFVSMGGAQTDNYCTGQCWYDNFVYTPKGNPNVVYLLGSFDYNQKFAGQSNARTVLLSTNAGSTWSDLTQDGDPNHAEFTHPDAHAIVTNPTNPFQYWQGSDGGVVRSDGKFADVSYKCDQRGLNAADTAYCKSLLSRVPNQLSNKLNDGFSTLQFQSLSVSPKNPQDNLQGGTQDNGTFQFNRSNKEARQEIYGDGGQSGFSSANDKLRFNTFTGQANDVNFRGGEPTKWVIATGPIVSSPEGAFFYPPVTADPHPANGGTIFQGSFSVWRTQDWGGNQAFLEANCPEFTTSAADPKCGDFVKIGAPTFTDLTDSGLYGPPKYGPNRRGGAIGAIERTMSNTATLWASTSPGRVFISDNSNAAAGSVVWNRVDPEANDPSRFISSIYIDPSNPHHAWISYSGYNVNNPTQPGHVFNVTWSGAGPATWADISHNLPDFPVTDLVRDDLTGDLYAASDFGVMKLPNGTTTWVVSGSGLPNVEVAGLTIVPKERILYAATHGRSAWELKLP